MTDCCGIQLKAQEMGKKGPFRYRNTHESLLNMLQIMNKLSHILYLFLSTKSNQSSFFFKKLNSYTKLDYTEN